MFWDDCGVHFFYSVSQAQSSIDADIFKYLQFNQPRRCMYSFIMH